MPIKPDQRLERILDLTHDLSAEKDMESYLQAILSAAVELTDSETASILEYDAEGQELHFSAVPWYHRELLKSISVPVNTSAAGWVVRKNEPLIIDDVSKDERHFRQVDVVSSFQTRSLLAVPLHYQGNLIGVFEALNKANNVHYTEEDITILETLGALAITVIQNDLLERRVQSSYEEVAELDRLKSDFIAITSHELRTPLGLILGHATFLRELLTSEYHEQLDAIIRNATKLKDIIENLSNVDNYQTGAARIRQRKISIARIAEEVILSFQEIAKQKNITLKADVGRNELLVEADGTKISIALSNLVKNAITFTDNGGHVFVTAEPVPGYVKVSVVDDGVGIPPQDLPRVFDRFFQVESHLTRRHGGMGLGLSVAKAMIEMHGGRIWAESVEGKGSNFTFLLPLDAQQANAASKVFSS
ncbi:MAG TPA: GAF domain-containing sensor histidine kinase [Anaerolineales bacterium]|nr:GAF domain-containing sensor histidine kinase [Anaerolineales bacterium]